MRTKATACGKSESRIKMSSDGAESRAAYFQEFMGRHLPDLHSLEEHDGKLNGKDNKPAKQKTGSKEPKTEGPMPTPEKFERVSDLSWGPEMTYTAR